MGVLFDNYVQIFITTIVLLISPIFINICLQNRSSKKNLPPLVYHWFPIIGSTVTYGTDPFKFLFDCQAKYGDIFTFILLGRKVTVYLGSKGNQFILNAKLKDVNAEEIYSVLTTPVFGKDVIYDFIKFGLTSAALRSYVPLMQEEFHHFVTSYFQGSGGMLQISPVMAEITLFTTARTLQGKEVRKQLDTTYTKLYHDLDDAFQPINFMMPWLPLPRNRRRDIGQRKMTELYIDIIKARRSGETEKDSEDMIWNLMQCSYKDGTPLPDTEIAHMMIGLLMAGQHSTSAASSWIMLHLAAQPEILEELYQEQLRVLGNTTEELTFEDLQKLLLVKYVIQETLRLHPSIHSIMRKVKNPLPIEGTEWVVPPSHVLLAAPATMGKSDEYFPKADVWDPHRWEHIADPQDSEKEKMDYGYGLVSTGADSTYLPFGAGRHRCIGEQFAYMQLTIVVSMMVRYFKLKNIRREGVVQTDYSSMFARPMDPAYVYWEKRADVS